MFAKLIDELIASGMTEAQIAEKIGRSQPSVNRMRTKGQVPDYFVGSRLVDLHQRTCPRNGGSPQP